MSNEPRFSNAELKHKKPKPSCFSWFRNKLFLGSFFPAIFLSSQRQLTFDDLSPLQGSHDINPWINSFKEKVNREIERPKGPRRYGSLIILLSIFWWRYLLLVFLNAFTIFLRAMGAVLLQGVLEQLALDTPKEVGPMATIVLIEAMIVMADPHIRLWSRCLFLRIEKMLTSALFERSLYYFAHDTLAVPLPSGLKNSGRNAQSNVYTLLASDASQMATAILYSGDILVTIISFSMLLATAKFWGNAPTCIAAATLGVLALTVIVLEVIAAGYQKSLLNYRDIRLGLCRNAVTDMKTLQMLNWTNVVANDLHRAREQELRILKRQTFITYLSSSIAQNLGALTFITFFGTFLISQPAGIKLTIFVIFPAQVAIRGFIRPLTHLGRFTQGILIGHTSCLRFETYLFRPVSNVNLTKARGYKSNVAVNTDTTPGERNVDTVVTVKEGVFTWIPLKHPATKLGKDNGLSVPTCPVLPPPHSELNQTIRVPKFELVPRECTMIVGAPGGGKTSFLLALLQEMALVSGQLTWHGRDDLAGQSALNASSRSSRRSFPVAYASQVSWIPSGTVRDAVLFGRPMDMARYNVVVDACELRTDFAAWPEGDQRLVADGAGNLSDGQRSRIALARALYGEEEARVCLLDQPFDKIDPVVGASIFCNLFRRGGVLAHSATVLTITSANAACFLNALKKEEASFGISFNVRWMKAGLLDAEPQVVHQDSTQVPDDLLLHDAPASSQVHPRREIRNATAGCPYMSAVAEACCEHHDATQLYDDVTFHGTRSRESLRWYIRRFGIKTAFLVCLLCFVAKLMALAASFWPVYCQIPPPATPAFRNDTAKHSDMLPRLLAELQDHPLPAPSDGDVLPRSRQFSDAELSNVFQPPPDMLLVPFNQQPQHPRRTPVTFTGRSHPQSHTKKTPPQSVSVDIHKHSFVSEPDNVSDSGVYRRRNLFPKPASRSFPLPGSSPDNVSGQKMHLNVYIGISLASIATLGISMLLQARGLLAAARRIHEKLVHHLAQTPLWFFDFISAGSIINRFAVDIAAVDLGLSLAVFGCVSMTCQSIILVVALCVIAPYTSTILVIAGFAVYLWTRKRYIPANKELQRLKLASLSPVSSLLSDVETASITIRAFHQETRFLDKNAQLISTLMQAEYAAAGTSAWLYIRQRLLLLPFISLVAFSPYVIHAFNIPNRGVGHLLLAAMHLTEHAQMATLFGFSVSQAFTVPDVIAFTLCQWGELQYRLCSAQRLCDLIKIMESGTYGASSDAPIPSSNALVALPAERTGLTFDQAVVSYIKPTLVTYGDKPNTQLLLDYYPPTLQGITAHASPGDTVGLVGRTGSGKTTLLLTLLNKLPVASGSVTLDGLPLYMLPDVDLMKVVGVVPQTPAITPGWTIRKLLDPENEFSTAELQSALERVDMLDVTSSLPHGLDAVIRQDPYARTLTSTSYKQAGYFHLDSSSAQIEPPDQFSQLLSESQTRKLLLARLFLNASTYRLIIIDEPPPFHGNDADLKNHFLDYYSREASTSQKEHQCQPPSPAFPNLASLLRSLFPTAIHIIIAHHTSAISGCNKLWILSKGRLLVRSPAPTYMSQEKLMQLLQEAETEILEN